MNNNKKAVAVIFFILVCLSVFSPLWTFKDLLFPYVTSKAFYFRICIELALPFYLYLLAARPDLRPKWKKNPLNWLMLIFLVLNLVSAFVGDNTVRSLWGNFERMGGVFYLANLTLLYFYVVMLGQMGGRYLKHFLQVFLLVALGVTVNGIFGKLGLPTVVQDPSLPGRVSSTLGNPIYLGSYLVVPMFLALFMGSQAEEMWKKWGYFFASFLFLAGIWLSGTRGAIVGLIIGGFLAAVVYVFFTSNKKLKTYGIIAVVVFAALCGTLYAFSSKLPAGSDFQRLFKLKDTNTSARLVQWGVALKGYKDHPFFGVGSENYYAIANKYYNPEIFQYDRSWFDKPHNYLLEILVTNGIFGFVVYVAMMVLVAWALYKGYKAGFLTLFEFSVLLSALLVYQIQNLTVFDTVPASLAFYSFVGFAGFIWGASLEDASKTTAKQQNKKGLVIGNTFSLAVGGVGAVVAIYTIYACNIVPMEIAKAVNYGSAYSTVDVTKADTYFQRALSLPFNFDQTQTASKYGDFAVTFLRTATAAQAPQAAKVGDEAIDALNQALVTQPDYPILWAGLAQVYLFKGVVGGNLVSVDPRAEESINKAIALAPEREEAYLTLAQIVGAEGNLTRAQSIVQDLIKKFPGDVNAKLQLATIYRIQNKTAEAVSVTEDAESLGYVFSSYDEMKWLVSYYVDQKQYDKALALFKIQTAKEPNNVAMFEDLARLYGASGDYAHAISIAQAVMQADPTTVKDMQALIDEVNRLASSTPVKK